MRLAILSTHPIQYYAPLFRRLHDGELDIHVFYEWKGMAGSEAIDHGFGRKVQWDIPLLDGYPHTFLVNRSTDPGTHHFRGIDAPDVIRHIEAWKPDALLVFGWNYVSHLRAMRYFSGRIPVVFRGDSTLLDEKAGSRTWLRRIVLKWVYQHIDLALYVGQNNRRYFEKHGVRGERLAWAPHAIDNERFAFSEGERTQEARSWRRKLGIPDDDRVILFVGKLEEKKDPRLLLHAFQSISAPGLHLVFGGTGPLEDELRMLAGSRKNVHFIGFQNQSRMPIVYRLGDVFVLPSKGPGETWGLAVNEAMVCSRSVIVSDRVGCAPDLVRQGENGWVFAAGNATALEHVLRCASADETDLETMGRTSAEIIRSWSIAASASRIEAAVIEYIDRSRSNTHTLSAKGA